MGGLLRDFTFTFRNIKRNPGFTLAVVMTLALGIGPNTAIFSVVNSVLLQPLPYENPDQLALIRIDLSGLEQHPGIAMAEITDFRQQSKTLESLGAVTREFTASITDEGNMETILAASVTPNLFPLLGVDPVLGRHFSDEEENPEEQRIAIIGYGVWQRRFAGDPQVIGKTIEIENYPVKIVGVMPESFQLLLGPGTSLSPDVEVWVPLILQPSRDFWAYRTIGRISKEYTLEQAQAEIETIGAGLIEQYPEIYENAGVHYYLHSLHGDLVQNVRTPIYILLGAVMLVLLIACTNTASLLLARNKVREKEFAVRTSLGAGRLQVLQQVISESLILAIIAGLAGLLLGSIGLKVLLALQPGNLPRVSEISLDPTVLLFTFGISVIATIIFSTIPALQASQVNPQESLRERGGSAGAVRIGARRILVITEVAFSLVLLIGAGLLIRSFNNLRQVDIGFRPESVATFEVPLEMQTFDTPENRWETFRLAQEKISALPGVISTGAISILPLANQNLMAGYSHGDAMAADFWTGVSADYRLVTPGYFETMEIQVLAGRSFEDRDNDQVQAVAVIDETLAREIWPDGNPIGDRLTIGLGTVLENAEVEVIGVVRHSRIIDVRREVRPQIYLPYRLGPGPAMVFTVRTTGKSMQIIPAVQTVLEEIGTRRPIRSVKPMILNVEAATGSTRFTLVLMSILAGIAIILSVVGVYSVIAYLVRQRIHELGIRMALGASRADIIRINIREGLILVCAGILIGLVGAALTSRFLQGILYGVGSTDLITFTVVPVVLLTATLLASYIPSRQASRSDPMVALRELQ